MEFCLKLKCGGGREAEVGESFVSNHRDRLQATVTFSN